MAKNKNKKKIRFGDIIELFDPIVDIVIWTEELDDEKDKPAYQGSLLDVPWYYLNYYVEKHHKNDDEPISIREDLGEELRHCEGIVISLVHPDYNKETGRYD